MPKINLILLSLITLFASCSQNNSSTKDSTNTETIDKQEVNVYSHRHYEIDDEIFKAFEKETNIKVNVIKAGADELINRIEMEGSNSPADLLVTVDAGRLHRAQQKGLLQAISSETIEKNIPAVFREQAGHWFGLTYRARVITYDKTKADTHNLPTDYNDLTKSEYEQQVLVRSSENIYNQSLLASIIANKGEEFAKTWAQGIFNNMAREPKGNDRDQMKALAAGEGSFAIVNSYYVGKLIHSDNENEKAVGNKIGVIFPSLAEAGTHINITGAGITAHAPNKENAIKLLEYLSGKAVQDKYAMGNYEYPVNKEAEWGANLKAWGEFVIDTVPLWKLGEYNTKAVEIFNEVGWE